MSNRAMAWAIDVKGIGGSDRLILMLLAECHNGKTGQCNPGLDWLQERTGLKERALQTRMKALENANLLDREYAFLGRGRGSQVAQYHLKIGIMGSVKDEGLDPRENAVLKVIDPQTDAPASKCARKNVQLDPHVGAVPYKEEPEENRKHNVSFEEAWNLYRSCKLKARQVKKLARVQWPKALKKADADTILKAIRREVEDRKDPKGFISNLPAMHRWLRDERWQDVEAVTPEQPKSLEDWKQAAVDYCELQIWPINLGPAPHQTGCKAPVGLLKSIANRMQGDTRHASIIQNIGEAA